MEIGLKHVLVILSGLKVLAKFPSPTSFDTEYSLLWSLAIDRSSKRSCNDTGLIPIFRKGSRTKFEKQSIRLKAEITDYLCFSHQRILRLPRYSLTFGFPWTRTSVQSPLYHNCSSNITRILSTILTRFDEVCLRALLTFFFTRAS